MKKRLIIISFLWLIFAESQAQLFKEGHVQYTKRFSEASAFDWEAKLFVFSIERPGELPAYEVRNEFNVSPNAAVVIATADRINFQEGEEISAQATEYFSAERQIPYLWLQAYRWEEPGLPEFIHPLYDEFPGREDVLIGAKYTDPDAGNVTLGWFRYRKDSLDPGNAYRLEESAYHPVPNEPIRAGFPPDLPEPTFAWGEEGLTVSWPENAWMLQLEMTETLTPPDWQPVPTGGSTSVTLPLDEQATLFFRLVAP